MCGIVGIVGNLNNKEKVLKEMNDIIAHRGPDDDGFFYSDYVSLAMRRLSIIDLSHGKQPISSFDGNYTIVFNGEIYNYQILRKELENEGFKFTTETDTEVILNLYIRDKENAVSKLRGMFAFAIFDKKENSLFIARDHFGIKPLYYIKQNNQIQAFGSEIKSLLKHPLYKKEINDEAVYNYLFFQYNPISETFFKNIFKLTPGHYLKLDLTNGSFVDTKYWEFSFAHEDIELEKGKEELQKILEDSVSAHMIADVPVGSFLSGGIDSSVISYFASKVMKKSGEKLSTFTIGFKEANEWTEAEQMVEKIDSDHNKIILDWKEYFEILPKIVWHFDEPVSDPSAVNIYFLAREARKKVKVVLSGEGSDELFGGYNIYLEPFAREKLQYLPVFMRKGLLNILTKISPNFRGINYLKRSLNNVQDWYIGGASIFKQNEVDQIWKGKEYKKINLSEFFNKDCSDSEKMQYVDINTWLIGDILAKADKMTMANSLELRVPFLDIEVAKFASKLKGNMKWNNGETKYILREAMKGVIPELTRKRKKLGFPTPVELMIKDNFSEVEKLIVENIYIKNNFNVDVLKRDLFDIHNPIKENSRKIYTLLVFALWHKEFFGE
ncbi:MAG: asparagine synthase (glutamine-hydrolyzing) [Candidatus Nomurabacteria bacterium]|nr:asparagine synthase (glutamine-hydrolyzing) [Candidatus Nomurabacteria bacterium]